MVLRVVKGLGIRGRRGLVYRDTLVDDRGSLLPLLLVLILFLLLLIIIVL
jgi:hypothetical protein